MDIKKTAGTTPRLTLTKLTKPNLMNYKKILKKLHLK
jgi:hypothetical protein